MENFSDPPNLKTRNNCRVCNHEPLEDIISLGRQSLINFIDSPSDEIYSAPLDLVMCNKIKGGCGLVQLRHTVPADLLYKQFWYRSGVNQSMRDALQDVVTKAKKLVKLGPDDIVIDIGSNDSTLLRFFLIKDLTLVGFEPATNLMDEARKGTTKIFNDFFNYPIFKKEFSEKKAKVITSISMFYDLEEPNKFVNDLVKMLDDEGICIIQMNYLLTMLENNAFDNIVHEHLEYYSLKSLENLLKKHDLVIFDVELNDINGGSIRTYIKHKNCEKYSINERVSKLRNEEDDFGLEGKKPYREFVKRINNIRKKTFNFIKNECENGKNIFVYGASTRGSTLLQFFNLDNKYINAAADRNPNKFGKTIVGTGIPIISEQEARERKPDYFLVLPWYFIDEFIPREGKFLKTGGKFIVPLPSFQIIEQETN